MLHKRSEEDDEHGDDFFKVTTELRKVPAAALGDDQHFSIAVNKPDNTDMDETLRPSKSPTRDIEDNQEDLCTNIIEIDPEFVDAISYSEPSKEPTGELKGYQEEVCKMVRLIST